MVKRIAARTINCMTAVLHYLWWRPRFGAFGFRSRLGRCKLLTNPKLIHIGKGVTIRAGARIEAIDWGQGVRAKMVIGDGSNIHFDVHIGAAACVAIGKDVLIAGGVCITDHDHRCDHPTLPTSRCHELISQPVTIGDGAWLGEGCVILKGVTVGERAVVGANAVVTRDVDPWTVVGGVPAKLIKSLKPVPKEK